MATIEEIEELLSAAKEGNIQWIQENFVNQGGDVNAATEDGWTALITAANNGHLDVVQYLLNNEADDVSTLSRTVFL
jgi:ankyrin repeat protein